MTKKRKNERKGYEDENLTATLFIFPVSTLINIITFPCERNAEFTARASVVIMITAS